MELSEYVLEPLRKDEEFILYRGQHGNQVDAPCVLLLAPVSTRPALESLKSMEHEYSLRAELDLSWAVRPLALSQLNGQTMLVLENPGGEPLDRLIQGPMEMTQFLRFAVGLATALNRLHKRGLIHDSASVIVSCFTALYFAPIASESNSGSCSCQTFNVSTTIEALSDLHASMNDLVRLIESEDLPLGDD
jgi:hypothetical protein